MRTKTITKTIYTFDELSDRAKEKAREWYREGNASDTFWQETIFEDAAQCAKCFGLDIRTRLAKLMGGGTRYEPCIFYSGFWSQGDGACFEGNYAYVKGASKAIRKHAPQDTELHRIADELQKVQQVNFYCIEARTKHRGHYYHEMCMDVEVFGNEDCGKDWSAVEETVTEALRDFARWIYRQLEKEYEYQNSDEVVDENIRCNEYEFNEDGSRA